MDKENFDDAQYFVTCTHCGTQAQLSLKEVEGNEPLKCPVCGAPLKIVPPPKRPAKKRIRRPGDYYLLHAERVEYERWVDGEYHNGKYWTGGTVAGIVLYAAAIISVILALLIEKC